MKKWKTKSGDTVVYKLPIHRCGVYVIKQKKYIFLVDTGMKRNREMLKASLLRLGIHKIDAVLLTHVHTDHVANAEYIRETYKSKVFVAESECNLLKQGFCMIPIGTHNGLRGMTKLINYIGIPFQYYEECSEVKSFREFQTDFECGIKVIETKGHTEGSVSFIIEDEIAIVGDAMVHSIPSRIYPPFADYPQSIVTAWKKLYESGSRIYLPAHGTEITRSLLRKSIHKYS